MDQNCPICIAAVPQTSRYPNYVCPECIAKATDINGNPVLFTNRKPKNRLQMPFGVQGKYIDKRKSYNSQICYISGIKCYADEAYFGGIVIRPFYDDVSGESLPAAYCYNRHRFKAFVLGADPTNFTNKNKTVKLRYAFGIGSGDNRYFDRILKNLEQVGLTIKDVYVQNLVQEYLEKETGKNPKWVKHAKQWVDRTWIELDDLDPGKEIPVLVTARSIMLFLHHMDHIPLAQTIYSCYWDIPFPSETNKLNRPLIPFYRNLNYRLDKPEWEEYRDKVRSLLQ